MKLPRPRFSLRTLVVFTLLVTSGAGLWWHWEAWPMLTEFNFGSGNVHGISFSDDGERAITVCYAARVTVWQSGTGARLASFGFSNDAVQCAAISPDGGRVAAGSWAGKVAAWDILTGKMLFDVGGSSTNHIFGLRFSRDGRRILAPGANRRLDILDASNGELVRSFEDEKGFYPRLFSPEQSSAVFTDGETIQVRDLARQEVIITLDKEAQSVEYSPDGNRIVGWSPHRAWIWELSPARRVATIEGGRWAFSRASLSNEGRFVLSCGWDESSKRWEAQLWSADDGSLLTRLCQANTADAAFFPNGNRIATSHDDGVIRIYRRRRPEWWWGVFWLWEFWLTVALAGVFVWSVVRDRRALGKEASDGRQ